VVLGKEGRIKSVGISIPPWRLRDCQHHRSVASDERGDCRISAANISSAGDGNGDCDNGVVVRFLVYFKRRHPALTYSDVRVKNGLYHRRGGSAPLLANLRGKKVQPFVTKRDQYLSLIYKIQAG